MSFKVCHRLELPKFTNNRSCVKTSMNKQPHSTSECDGLHVKSLHYFQTEGEWHHRRLPRTSMNRTMHLLGLLCHTPSCNVQLVSEAFHIVKSCQSMYEASYIVHSSSPGAAAGSGRHSSCSTISASRCSTSDQPLHL